MKQDLIVILDLGSTQNTVIARRIRDLGVYSEIHPHDITAEELKAFDNVKGIKLSGNKVTITGTLNRILPDDNYKKYKLLPQLNQKKPLFLLLLKLL